jgi:hypothetical protein
MAEYEFITAEQASNRISPQLLKRLTDDDRNGVSDTPVVDQLRYDATSFVASYLRGIRSLDEIEARLGESKVHEVVRLTLDAFEWMAIKRHPAAAREHNWVDLRKANVDDLKLQREAFTRLDSEEITAPENVGGTIYPATTSYASQNTFRSGGFGDY